MTWTAGAPPHAVEAILAFLTAHGRGSGSDGLVVGLSGGIDSALVARLARDAIGADRVSAVLLPDAAYPRGLAEETAGFAASLGLEFREVRIDPIEGAFRGQLPELSDRTDLGNLKARIRMAILYSIARSRRRLVVGTGNKSELLTGYFTKWGDGGVDLLPLGDLYKTGVREVAEQLGLPDAIRRRVPTAGFWEGQTDEGELGLSYERLDRILRGLEELRNPEEIAETLGEPPSVVVAVAQRVREHRHKRRLPPIPKISLRTVGLDWRD